MRPYLFHPPADPEITADWRQAIERVGATVAEFDPSGRLRAAWVSPAPDGPSRRVDRTPEAVEAFTALRRRKPRGH